MGALDGRRVVVTRAADQADHLAGLLRARGAEPVVVPLIEIQPVAGGVAALTAHLAAGLDGIDWVAVTSPNGAGALLAAAGAAPSVPARIAAVGDATAQVLRDAGLQVDLVPAVQRADGLVAEFPAGPGRVLVVQAVDAEPALADGLVAKGWHVIPVAPYRSVPARPPAALQLAALAADAVLFASGSAATAWVAVFGTTTPPLVVAIGPRTAAAAATAGLKIDLVAADHSMPGLVAALESHLSTLE
ncbi:MAG: uroporphyrinogen-III synthase [Acidimicrobiaceae bacterium]|nr:uroporphyrinogen-III synthase [Ilumatobacter sp.]MCB9381888.1 uroporphyrinogen-III synthase [Acidimicrobiaceae bacterium]MCO5328706.1 uroporphyrinogen-III synthase [Ilumatobacteraceae bacterium]